LINKTYFSIFLIDNQSIVVKLEELIEVRKNDLINNQEFIAEVKKLDEKKSSS